MRRPILTVPNPLLREKSKAVEKFDRQLKKLARDLIDSAAEGPIEKQIGVGLSAVQIGIPVRLLVAFDKKSKKYEIIINPGILSHSKKMTRGVPDSPNELEGCLSVPGYWSLVPRFKKINLSYQDLSGDKLQKEFSGFTATIIQHEIDHLDGILFIDRALAQKSPLYAVQKDKDGKECLTEIPWPR